MFKLSENLQRRIGEYAGPGLLFLTMFVAWVIWRGPTEILDELGLYWGDTCQLCDRDAEWVMELPTKYEAAGFQDSGYYCDQHLIPPDRTAFRRLGATIEEL